MKHTTNWEKSTQRYGAYWQGELLDRCCVSVTAPKGPRAPLPAYTPEEVLKRWTDGEWLHKTWQAEFENTYFAGDAFPNLWLNLGPSGHAGYVKGAQYTFMHSHGIQCTTWYTPSIQNWDSDFPVFAPDGLLYQKTLEVARYLAGENKNDFILSMPDIAGNLDALAHLRGSEDLLIDILDEQEEILRASDTMQEIWEQTLSDVYAIAKNSNGGGSSVGWLQVYAQGLMSQMQCDLSVMISPDTFTEMAMPELRRQCDFLPYPLYHFDGQEQRRHLDQLLSLEKLRVIQWTPVDGQPSPVEYLDTLRRIQQAGKSLFLMLQPNEIEPIMNGLSSKGLHFSVTAQTPQQADDIVKQVEKLTHE